MTKLRRTIYAYEVDGQPRMLFTIGEDSRESRADKFGELTITRMHGKNYGYYQDSYKPAIQTEKYSVHPSIESAEFNKIQHSLIDETLAAKGLWRRSSSMTDAIKLKSGFSMLFVRLCPDLRDEIAAISARDLARSNLVILGKCDPRRQTVAFGVAVSHRDKAFGQGSFKLPEYPAFGGRPKILVSEQQFQMCRVTVLHALSPLPSGEGTIRHFHTFPPESFSEPAIAGVMRSAMKGKTRARMAKIFAATVGFVDAQKIRRTLGMFKNDPEGLATLEALAAHLFRVTENFHRKAIAAQSTIEPQPDQKPANRH